MFKSIGAIAAAIYIALIVRHTAQLTDSVQYLTITSIAMALTIGTICVAFGDLIDESVEKLRNKRPLQ